MSRSVSNTDLAVKALREEVARLRGDIGRGRQQRKLIFIAMAFLLVAAAALFVLYIDVIMGRSASRRYYNNQQHTFACVLVQFTPPGDRLGDQLRDQYDCPDYQPPTRRSGSSSSAPSSNRESLSSTPARSSGNAEPAPTAPTGQSPQRSPAVGPTGPRTTTTVRPPASTRTVTRPGSTSTRSAPRSAPTSQPGLLAPVCGLLGLTIC